MIITIIVLIILAGTTLSIALGNNGIFKKSQKAVDEYQKQIQIEQNNLENTYRILGELTPLSISEAVNTNNYGDYVDYGIDLNGDGKPNDWKIFYKGENEANKDRIFIIAADYVPTSDYRLSKIIESSENKITKSTEIDNSDYCIKWKDAPTYICNDGQNELNKDRIQCLFPDIFESKEYYCSANVGSDGKSGYTNSRCVSELQCTRIWSGFVNQYAEYAIGGPTLEMWVNSWNQKHGNNTDEIETKPLYYSGKNSEEQTNSTGYYIGTTETNGYVTSTFVNGSSYYGDVNSGYGDTLYFPHRTGDLGDIDNDNSNEYVQSYWLASPSGEADNKLMYVSYDGTIAGFVYYSNVRAIRPLICLKSSVCCHYNKDKHLYTLEY